MSLPLPILFANSLFSASKAFNRPTIEDSTQELIQSSLHGLLKLRSQIAGLSLFSPNETLEDIATKDLVYLLVPYVISEIRGRVRTKDRDERLLSLREGQNNLREYLSYLEIYDIVPEDERALHEHKTVLDPAKRRELKIKQYQKEKDLRARIEVVRKRRGQLSLNTDDAPSDFDLISSLLPSPSHIRQNTDDEDEELDAETDDILREATLLLLRLFHAHSHSQLESMAQELELLEHAPPSPPQRKAPDEDHRGKARQKESDMWRLDALRGSLGQDGKGPLLDPTGKPLRPFTILPSDAADRARIQAQIFGPGHRLPTMSIDEYLQIERERGNIISGGGPASEAAPTSSEQLALEAEMDGTREGEENAEAKRLKDENWARFTDENPRGAGNTMNHG